MKITRRIIVAVVSFAVFAAAGAFASTWIFDAPITGSTTTGKFAPSWTSATAGQVSGMQCSATLTADKRISLVMAGVMPGANCTVTGGIALPSDATVKAAKIDGVSLTLPKGMTASLRPLRLDS